MTSESSPDRAKNIVQGMGSLTAQNLATSVLGFVFVATLIHLLPQEQYGIYSAVLLSAGIASSFAVFGLNTTTARYIALLSEEDEPSSWVAARKIFFLSAIFSVIVTGAFLVISPFLSVYFTKSGKLDLDILSGRGVPFVEFAGSRFSGYHSRPKRYGTLAKILFASRLVMTVFAMATPRDRT